jgi:tetratricopeptide (TPR) repeat protein
MPTLQLIASRTGKPLNYFLAEKPSASVLNPATVDPRLSEMERLVAVHDFAAAIDLGRTLLDESLDPAAEAHVNYHLGLALERVDKPDQALPHVQRAKTLYQQLGDRWGFVEVLDLEARALYLLEDPRAMAMAEEALRLCVDLEPRPAWLEVRILRHLGSMHVLRREFSQAIKCFELAVETAGALRDLTGMAHMYDDLSIAYQETGNLGKAASYAQRALGLLGMVEDHGHLARAENNLGLLLMKQGNFQAAEHHLQTSLEHCEAIGLDRGRAHVLLSLGELHLNRGDLDAAEPYFQEASTLAESLGEKLTLALAHQFLGRVAADRGDDEESDSWFWSAIELLSHERAAERLIECHAAYAHVLEDRGDTRTANQHWKEALAASRPGLVRPLSLDSELIARAN